MDLNVELTCLDSGKTEHIKITINDWDGKFVKELKEILEDEIQVPSCDQNLFYQERPLSDNLFPLKKLYLRQGDTILVECIAQGYLSEMKDVLKEVSDFANAITSQNQSDLLSVCSKKDIRTSYVSYDYIGRALENLSFNYFIPWKNAQSVVHRHYFVQEGAFDAFMEVLKFANKRYRREENPSSRKLFGKSKEKESEALADLVKELNNEQMMLQMHCLSLLWNFSETFHDRRLVLQKGGLQLVIKALMLDPTEYSVPTFTDEYYEVASINETAVGCLVQYAEFPDCQEIIASSSGTVGKLMFMVGSQFHFDQHENAPIIETYNKYPAQIAANTLFCCACSLQTPRILVENNMHKRMINLMSLVPHDELAFSYYCTLFLARIGASPLVHLDPHEARSINDIIASFLAKNKPSDVSSWEENHNYVWVSMTPFVSLAFSGREIQKKNESLAQSGPNKHAELENYDLNKCAGVSENHQFVLVACQDKMDGPNLLPANQSDVFKNDMEGKNAVIKTKMEGSDISNPADTSGAELCSMTEESPETLFGSMQTQKLGLFTLQHMLYSSGNRQLVEGEHLLSYLECLCWHISPGDGRLLRAELRKYWSPKPAALAVMCKSSLAFVYGFEAALKM